MPSLGLALSLPYTQPPLHPDPVKLVPFQLRLQTHKGDNKPFQMFTNTGGTVKATTAGDAVAVWGTATQSTSGARGTLQFVNGTPVLDMDNVDDSYATPLFLTGGAWCVSILEIPKAGSDAARTVSSGNFNILMSPGRSAFNYYYGEAAAPDHVSPPDIPVIASMSKEPTNSIHVYVNGALIGSSLVNAENWGQVCIGNQGAFAEPSNTKIIAIMVYPYYWRDTVEAYLETLKPAEENWVIQGGAWSDSGQWSDSEAWAD